MGCKQSGLRGPGLHGKAHDNNNLVPSVPPSSWYAQPFTEDSPMEMTPFHASKKGQTIFSSTEIPLGKSAVAAGTPPVTIHERFVIGQDSIFGTGFLHNTALYIEHYWRTRVAHDYPGVTGTEKYDRPFYNMLLGIKVFLDDVLVPDLRLRDDSLTQCTTTIEAHEATTTWLCVPFVLMLSATQSAQNTRLLTEIELYQDLAFNCATAMARLAQGTHELRVEVVYGCRSENDFCTDFISRGSCFVEMQGDASRAAIQQFLGDIRRLMDERKRRIEEAVAVPAGLPNPWKFLKPTSASAIRRDHGPAARCAYCASPLRYLCTICGAQICGAASCVWSKFPGYPFGCQTHKGI